MLLFMDKWIGGLLCPPSDHRRVGLHPGPGRRGGGRREGSPFPLRAGAEVRAEWAMGVTALAEKQVSVKLHPPDKRSSFCWAEVIVGTRQVICPGASFRSCDIRLMDMFPDGIRSLVETSPAPDIIVLPLMPEIIDDAYTRRRISEHRINRRC